MANTSINLVNIDFATLKNSLKSYLRNNLQFKDYDYEGSNMNVLLDILSYNTFKNAFYHNMVMSEAFLDSAQVRSSIVSHAKDLNYIPVSRRSPKASVTVTFEADGNSAPYIIPKGSPLSTLVKNSSYTFTIPETIVVSSANNTYSFTTDIYEGIYIKDTYTVLSDEDGIRYKITNPNVDTNSITVVVFEDGAEVGENYKVTSTLLGLNNNSKVFFLQAVGSGYYEILFGDNIFGRRPKINSTIVIDYRVTEGPAANGARLFSVDFDPTGNDELLFTPEATTIDVAADGAIEQSIESIRQNAPRFFATQQRAVSSDDYASLLLSQFSGTIDDVNVYGGETVEPKLYGRVIVAVKPVTGDIVPNFIKDEITNYLLEFVSLPTRVIITDPEYFHCEVNTTVQYDLNATVKSSSEIRGIVLSAIQEFSADNLEKFDRDFRYSRFVNTIDNSDSSIISNDTIVKIVKRLQPTANQFSSFEIKFNNRFHPQRGTLLNPVVTSSAFTYIDEDETEYPLSYIQDNGSGTLIVYSNINNQFVVLNNNIGTVDHTNGIIYINKLLVSNFGTHLSIYVTPALKDLIMNQQNVLLIDAEDISINVIGKLD